MKQCVVSLLIMIFFISKVSSQTQEVKQLLLDVEKLTQLKSILTDLKEGYMIVSNGYNAIKNVSEGNFNLHQLFLNSLLEISPSVKKYKRIADIISTQITFVSEYKKALRQIKASGKFSIDEIDYISLIYSNLFNHSVKNLDALATVVTANKLRMSDDERLRSIDAIWKDVEDQKSFFQYFTNQTKILALQKAKEQNDLSTMNQLYNVKP